MDNSSLSDILSFDPPDPILSDWIELTYLILLFAIGAPLNTAACTKLNEKQQMPRRKHVRRLETLKKHVNYSDLLIIFLYIPSRVCWTLTYQWRGGPLLCKFIKFGQTFAFQVRVMLLLAWVMAFIISLPQVVVYSVFMLGENWEQCVSIWNIERYELIVDRVKWAYAKHISSNGTVTFNVTSDLHAYTHAELTYTIIHQMFVFVMPTFVIAVCYIFVAIWLLTVRIPMESQSTGKASTGSTSLPIFPKIFMNTSDRNPTDHKLPKYRLSDAASSLNTWRKSHSFSLSCLPLMSNSESRSNQQTETCDSQYLMLPNQTLNNTNFEGVPNTSHKIPKKKSKNQMRTISECLLGRSGEDRDDDFVTCGENTSVYYTTFQEDEMNSTTNLSRRMSNSEPSINTLNSEEMGELHASTTSISTANCGNSVTDNRPTAKRSSVQFREIPLAPSHNSICNHRNVYKVRRNNIRVSGLLVFAYIVCWLPYNVLITCSFIYPEMKHSYKRSFYMLKDFIALNAVLNPFLYGMFGNLRRYTRSNA